MARWVFKNILIFSGSASPNKCCEWARAAQAFSDAAGSDVTRTMKLARHSRESKGAPTDTAISDRRVKTNSPSSRGNPAIRGQIGVSQRANDSSVLDMTGTCETNSCTRFSVSRRCASTVICGSLADPLAGWVPGESEFDGGSAAAPPLINARAAMDTAQRTTSCPTRRRLVARFETLGVFVASVATESPSPAHRRQHGTVAPSHQLGRRQAIGRGREALQTPPAPPCRARCAGREWHRAAAPTHRVRGADSAARRDSPHARRGSGLSISGSARSDRAGLPRP